MHTDSHWGSQSSKHSNCDILPVWRPCLLPPFFLHCQAWAMHCVFPSSCGVQDEGTAGCSVEPDGPGVLLSWNLQHRGIYTCHSCHSLQMDQTVFPERWAWICHNPALQKSRFSFCRLAGLGRDLPALTGSSCSNWEGKPYFALPLFSSLPSLGS